MSKASYNAVMRELKAIKKQMVKEAKHEKFKAMKENAKNERAVDNLARDKKPSSSREDGLLWLSCVCVWCGCGCGCML